MKETPALIAILVAGADGVIDEKEMYWAEKVKIFRSSKEDSMLKEYYSEAVRGFRKTMEELIEELPINLSERNYEITKRLKGLNKILPKLNRKLSIEFYKSLLSYAEQVAKASGGIMGFASISPEERKWLSLDMIKDPSEKG
ncbi:MAG: hypothetical protein ISS16_05230 [Ignavibacteria bacterium]|nr:hypothetical protein [Ignavibacteria bacterium]